MVARHGRVGVLILCGFTSTTHDYRSAIAHPYPPSHFCLPAAENRMRLPLCCPIPQDLFRQRKPADATLAAVPHQVSCSPRVSRGCRSTVRCGACSLSPGLSELSAPPSVRRGTKPVAAPLQRPQFGPIAHAATKPTAQRPCEETGDKSSGGKQPLHAALFNERTLAHCARQQAQPLRKMTPERPRRERKAAKKARLALHMAADVACYAWTTRTTKTRTKTRTMKTKTKTKTRPSPRSRGRVV